jgi:hypothetical protein
MKEAWMSFATSWPPSRPRRRRFLPSVGVCISRSITASRPRRRSSGSASCRLGGASCTNASMRYVNLSGFHPARREHRPTRPLQERKPAKACSASSTGSLIPGSEPGPRSQTIQNVQSGNTSRAPPVREVTPAAVLHSWRLTQVERGTESLTPPRRRSVTARPLATRIVPSIAPAPMPASDHWNELDERMTA